MEEGFEKDRTALQQDLDQARKQVANDRERETVLNQHIERQRE